MMDFADQIKLFGMSHAMVERDLDRLESRSGMELQRDVKDDRDQEYYPQFAHALRIEAAEMGRHYEVFYCLEKTIRTLIAETLNAAHGAAWWTKCVPQIVRDNAGKNINREHESGVTPRSEKEIDYTTFGELGDIVRGNWGDFGSIFSNEKAFTRIMTNLNTLRGPIAHCCALAEDEVVRLRLAVKDWFRLME